MQDKFNLNRELALTIGHILFNQSICEEGSVLFCVLYN